METTEIKNSNIQPETTEITGFIKNIQDFIKDYPYEIALVVVIIGVILYKVVSEKNISLRSKEDIPKIIWIYWNTPIEKAPEIVQISIQLIQKFNPTFQIKILNQENYKEYVTDKIIIQLMNSKLSLNFKSDLLRFYLLYNYGGIYSDASILPLQSFDWVVDKLKGSNNDVFFYKNIHHTTNQNEPICESWFIGSYKGNNIIKILLDNFIKSLINGIDKSYKELINDKDVDYQNFITHGPYHLVYFVMINALSKNKLHPYIIYENCSYNKYPCKYFHNHYNINELYHKSITQEELNDIQDQKLIKLTGTNRKYIDHYKLKIKENSLLYHLINHN